MSAKDSKQIEVNKVDVAKNTFIQILIPPAEDNNFIMRKFIVKKDGFIPEHKNLVEHQQYVLSGKAVLKIGNETINVKRDSVVFIPAGVPHSYKNTGDSDFEFLCLIPKQEDKMTLIE